MADPQFDENLLSAARGNRRNIKNHGSNDTYGKNHLFAGASALGLRVDTNEVTVAHRRIPAVSAEGYIQPWSWYNTDRYYSLVPRGGNFEGAMIEDISRGAEQTSCSRSVIDGVWTDNDDCSKIVSENYWRMLTQYVTQKCSDVHADLRAQTQRL
jgi:hypothetical protein